MRKVIAATAIAATAVLAGGAGYALHSQTATQASCTFDGGGTIESGTPATTSEGQTWFCVNGTLIRYYG